MKNLKVIDTSILKDWAKEIFTSNNFHMVDVSQKQNTHRKALAMGKIYVGEKTFKLIQNKKMPKGDPISLAEVASLLGVKKTSEIIPLCHPLSVDYSSTKIIQNADDYSLDAYCVVAAFAKTGVEFMAVVTESWRFPPFNNLRRISPSVIVPNNLFSSSSTTTVLISLNSIACTA